MGRSGQVRAPGGRDIDNRWCARGRAARIEFQVDCRRCAGHYANGMKLGIGHRLIPVPSPFCHFRGAVMLYDPETRVLFSGDLFGGLTAADATGIWADESDWRGIRAFHQLYMPANKALAGAVARIRALDPLPAIIAPQHGRVIKGALVREFLDRMEQLPVGLDILGEDASTLDAWNTVLERVLATATTLADEKALEDSLSFEGTAPEITSRSAERARTIGAAHGGW